MSETIAVRDQCLDRTCVNGECVTGEDGSALCECSDGYKGDSCSGATFHICGPLCLLVCVLERLPSADHVTFKHCDRREQTDQTPLLRSVIFCLLSFAEVNAACAEMECTDVWGKCLQNGTESSCQCGKDFTGPTCSGAFQSEFDFQ